MNVCMHGLGLNYCKFIMVSDYKGNWGFDWKTLHYACHKKTRPPIFGSPRSKYIEIFGPPGSILCSTFICMKYLDTLGRQKFLKYLNLLEIFYPPITFYQLKLLDSRRDNKSHLRIILIPRLVTIILLLQGRLKATWYSQCICQRRCQVI